MSCFKICKVRGCNDELEDIESGLILPNGAGDGEIILRSKKAYEDRRPEMGDSEKALNGNLPV